MRKRLRFSLKALLVLFTVLSVWLGLEFSRAHNRRHAIDHLAANYCSITYVHEAQLRSQGSLPKAPPALKPWWIRRLLGNEYCFQVQEVRIPAGSDSLMAELRRLPEMEALHVTLGACTDAGVDNIAHLKALKRLSLGHGRLISNSGLSFLSRLDELESLSLGYLAVDDQVVSLIAGMENLRELTITQTFISPGQIDQLRKVRPDLEVHYKERVISPSLWP